VYQLFIDSKKAFDSARREVWYNISLILVSLARLIRMCETETYSRVQVGKNLSDMFPIRSGVDVRIMLRRIFRKSDVVVWTGLIWLRIETGGGHL
jgi:hypothetical protein